MNDDMKVCFPRRFRFYPTPHVFLLWNSMHIHDTCAVDTASCNEVTLVACHIVALVALSYTPIASDMIARIGTSDHWLKLVTVFCLAV